MEFEEITEVSIPSCNVDRISSLPDDVLIRILSFLSTKYSVATRILSTRWKHLFASVPVLDFYYSLTSLESSSNTESSFLEFVKWVFQSHNSLDIVKFRFHYNATPNYDTVQNHVNCWISKVVHRSVREIDIYSRFLNTRSLPCFSCKTLKTLRLGAGGASSFSISDSVCLPCLKTLEIRQAYIVLSTQRLFSGCQVLEDLLILDCKSRGIEIIDISIPTLKRLRIENFICNTLLLNIPGLEHFDFVKSIAHKICGESLNSLHEAVISPHEYNETMPGRYNPNTSRLVIGKLLELISNARHLYLSSSVFEAFGCFRVPTLPTFQSLARLELGIVPRLGVGLLPKLLERSVNLQVLVLSEGFSDKDASYSCFFLDIASLCVSLHLREIEFRNFSMRENECNLVKYILENAKVLDKMVIQPSSSLGNQEETRNKLQSFSHCSKTCQIVIK